MYNSQGFSEISIVDAAARCGIKLQPSGRIEVAVNCPFCGGRKRHMSVNVVKNVFFCHRCGMSGNAITLYAGLAGTDRKTAYRELSVGNILPEQRQSTVIDRVTLPLSERHAVYSELLQSLRLSPKHRDNLLNRGLDSTAITRNLYRTTPDYGSASRISEVLAKHHALAGVPGFYTRNKAWTMAVCDGFFIPVRSPDSLIQGLQIRLDNAKRRKYRWFSSNGKENGTAANAWIHAANVGGGNVFITEGALKADIAAHLSGDCFIGISGVNCVAGLAPLLHSLDAMRVYETLDMDKFTNENVNSAARKLHSRLTNAGITCVPCIWDSRYKGIDDYLWSNYNESGDDYG